MFGASEEERNVADIAYVLNAIQANAHALKELIDVLTNKKIIVDDDDMERFTDYLEHIMKVMKQLERRLPQKFWGLDQLSKK